MIWARLDPERRHQHQREEVLSRTLFRIYRDTRFSTDKTPYKTYIAAMYFRPGIPKNTGAGFYFSVSHETVEIAVQHAFTRRRLRVRR